MTVKSKSGVTRTLVIGKAPDIIGTTSMIAILAPTLLVDLVDVMVSSGDFYQFFDGDGYYVYIIGDCGTNKD